MSTIDSISVNKRIHKSNVRHGVVSSNKTLYMYSTLHKPSNCGDQSSIKCHLIDDTVRTV